MNETKQERCSHTNTWNDRSSVLQQQQQQRRQRQQQPWEHEVHQYNSGRLRNAFVSQQMMRFMVIREDETVITKPSPNPFVMATSTSTSSTSTDTTADTATANANAINPKSVVSSTECNNTSRSQRSIHDRLVQLPKEIRNIIAGGIAGMVAKSVVAPVDRIKILYQISAVPFHLRDIPNVVMTIIKEEGVVALWRGNMATMIRVFPYSGIQFMTFDWCKTYFLQKNQHHHHHNNNSQKRDEEYHQEAILRSYSTNNNHHIITASSPAQYNPVIDPTTIHNTIDSGTNLTHSHSTPPPSKQQQQQHNRHDRKYGISPLESLISGMIAGTVSVICTYPLDLVRAQLAVLKHPTTTTTTTTQTSNTTIVTNQHAVANSSSNVGRIPAATTPATTITSNHGFVRVLRDNYTRGGVSGLFRGITPTLFGILPYSGIAFTLNEQGKREIQHYMGRDVTTMERLQCGAFSGLIAQTVTYPIEVTRRRMQTLGIVRQNDTALSSCLRDVKVALPTTATSTTTNGATSITQTSTLSTASHLHSSSSISSSSSSPPSLYTTITHLYHEQGIRGFLKGVSMNWMKGPIAFAISFTTFDHVQQLLENPMERRS
jgi:Mitochondrial carrier protein